MAARHRAEEDADLLRQRRPPVWQQGVHDHVRHGAGPRAGFGHALPDSHALHVKGERAKVPAGGHGGPQRMVRARRAMDFPSAVSHGYPPTPHRPYNFHCFPPTLPGRVSRLSRLRPPVTSPVSAKLPVPAPASPSAGGLEVCRQAGRDAAVQTQATSSLPPLTHPKPFS